VHSATPADRGGPGKEEVAGAPRSCNQIRDGRFPEVVRLSEKKEGQTSRLINAGEIATKRFVEGSRGEAL